VEKILGINIQALFVPTRRFFNNIDKKGVKTDTLAQVALWTLPLFTWFPFVHTGNLNQFSQFGIIVR